MWNKSSAKLVLIALVSLAIFWGPFWAKWQNFWQINFGQLGMATIVQNFDGLNFLVVAKSAYKPEIIEEINAHFLTGNDPIYFVAHFPAFALIIRGLATVLSYPNALLVTIVLSNLILAAVLYWFYRENGLNDKWTLLIGAVALFFPARMLSVRAVGSNEPLFIALILASIILARKRSDWWAAIVGALAVLTRSPGILLFGAYCLTFWREPKRIIPYLIMPITLLGLFGYYGVVHQDFLAYFHSGDNIHLFFPPFAIFSNTQTWINDMWREDLIYLYLFYALGLTQLKDKLLKNWALAYGLTLLLVAHRDLARYALPLSPLVLLGYAPWISRIPSKYLWVGSILLIPIYLLGWQFVVANVQPISDWSVFQ